MEKMADVFIDIAVRKERFEVRCCGNPECTKECDLLGGYGFAAGGLGAYEFCNACGVLTFFQPDEG